MAFTIGLTGAIGAGKSFVAQCFKNFGAAVFDADSIVHQLYKEDENIIEYAKENLPGVVIKDEINRAALREHFLKYDETWLKFQSLVHSIIKKKLELFINEEKNKKFLILDIPLLLEAEFHLYCDYIILVSVNENVRKQRLNERGVDNKILDLISRIQLPIEKRKKMSHFTICADNDVLLQVKEIVNSLSDKPAFLQE